MSVEKDEKDGDKKVNIIVAGYFNRHNLGDDLFLQVWQYIFSKPRLSRHVVKYVGLDELKSCRALSSCEVLIFAGGDVLNYYFLSGLRSVLHQYSFKGNLYAFSVGIPYQVVIVDGLLDKFNFIMCRSKDDAFTLRNRFGESHVRYFPDLSIYLPEMFQLEKPKVEHSTILESKVFTKRLNVGVFLARTIFEKNANYDKIVKNISICLDKLVEMEFPGICGFELFLIPFNTNERNVFENDMLINRDVYSNVTNKDYIHLIEKKMTVEEMFILFKNQLDFNITMRYHAHMYSVVSKVPFMSIYTTRKVQNLLFDLKVQQYSYPLPLNEDDLPLDFSVDNFLQKFHTAFSDRTVIMECMKRYISSYSSLESFDDTLATLLENPNKTVNVRSRVYPATTINNVLESLISYIWSNQGKLFTEKDVSIVADEIYKGKLTFAALIDKTLTSAKREKLSDFLAALACFGLVHIPYPKYHYGLSRKILNGNFNAKNEFMWLWSDYQKNNEKFFLENPMIRRQYFNATFVGIEDFKGCHRSGWQYTLDHLMAFHSETSPMIFDNYIDRTFHWAHDVYKYTHIIPFERPWCGFVHHTFDETYSPFNVPNLFRNETFLESLKCCHALFTLSNDLATKIKVLLQQYGFKNVLVKAFTHPTEVSKVVFSMEKFLQNDARKVVQIGAWLRNNYAIYKLLCHSRYPTKYVTIQKAVLRGKHMNNYFKPDDLTLMVKGQGVSDSDVPVEYGFNKGELSVKVTNKFVEGVLANVHEQWNSVEVIDTLDNEEYDKLLSENIVFLNLIDASAVNTIIECIVRSTPVLVNRHAAVEEMLGQEYPFYYEDMLEAGLKVNDVELISKTNKYLQAMNKKKYTMEYFLQDVDDWFQANSIKSVE
jgi:hypothetical protein